MLYDLRSSIPVNKVILKLRSNVVAWNPMEAFMFTAANEDHKYFAYSCCYTRFLCVLVQLMIYFSIGCRINLNLRIFLKLLLIDNNSSLYTFDIRRLDFASNVHTDHADAVLDVDYAPTGKEFVSGSYDK